MVGERNKTVDIIRGIAIIMVMMGHCITTNTLEAENTVFFNVIWSLQMPLFFLISGYVSRYSKPITDAKGWLGYIRKRTFAYLMPWLVWTLFIRNIIMGYPKNGVVSYLKNLVFNMDSGYWFLWVLWVICVIFSIASFLSNKMAEKPLKNTLITCAVSVLLSGIPLCIGKAFGLNFLATKLILYYLPFYYIGYLFARLDLYFRPDSKAYMITKRTKTALFLPMLFAYLFVIYHHNLYISADSAANIMVRFFTSLIGCGVVCYCLPALAGRYNRISSVLVCAGRHSLEIYLIHCMFLSLIQANSRPLFATMDGILLCVVNFVVMIGLTAILTAVMSSNKYSKWILFGKNELDHVSG